MTHIDLPVITIKSRDVFLDAENIILSHEWQYISQFSQHDVVTIDHIIAGPV